MFNDGIAINEIHSKIETIKGEEKKVCSSFNV